MIPAWVRPSAAGRELACDLVVLSLGWVAFAGFNHGFLHVPAVEIAMVWLAAHLRGDLALPVAAEMERCIDELRAWKRRHTLFEPSRGCAIHTRFTHMRTSCSPTSGCGRIARRGCSPS
jgi:hypothetical protein